MKIYNYNKDTKEFISQSQAVQSPLEKDVFIIPANATKVEPLESKQGFAIYFNEEKKQWEYIEDNRDKTVYKIETKEETKINYLGEIKDGFTSKVPNSLDKWNGTSWEVDLDELKKSRTTYVNSLCQTTIISGFTSSALGKEHKYLSNNDDQINIMGLVTAGVDDFLKCFDGEKWEWKLHLKDELRQVFDDGVSYKKELLLKANRLRTQIEQATSIQDLEKVVW